MIATAFTWVTAALLVGALLILLADIPAPYWTRPCKGCFWAAIALLVVGLGLPGWYFLAAL